MLVRVIHTLRSSPTQTRKGLRRNDLIQNGWNTSRDEMQRRVWYERLLTSPDFDELSKDWTEYQEESARHNAWKRHKELRGHKDFFKCFPPTNEEVNASAAKTDHKVERLGVRCRQWCFSAFDERKSQCAGEENQEQRKTTRE